MASTYPGETRAWGWGVREPLRLGALAPDKRPSWLKPQSYWKKIVADNLAFTQQYMRSPARFDKIFRQFPRADFFQCWENAFLMSSVGWAAWSGFYPEWTAMTYWFAGSLLPLVSGTSGWDRRWPAPYNVVILGARDIGSAPPPALAITNTSWDASTPDDWSEVWTLFPKWLATPNCRNYSNAPRNLDPTQWTDPDKIDENGTDSRYGSVKVPRQGRHIVCRSAARWRLHPWRGSRSKSGA